MKRFTLIIASLALLIGFSQCKKDNDTPNTNDSRIQITLNANYGDNGSKTTFNPADGTFNWLQGVTQDAVEYINVGGSKSGYLGQLNNSDNKGTGTFKGSITTPENGETLYFFYLGNGSHAGATTVDFSSQDGTSTNVTKCHIAMGSQEYTGQSSFGASLEMAMAIAYFNLEEFDSETVYLNGDEVYSVANIDYRAGTITGSNKGYIKAGTASSGMYVALIPSVNTETTINFISNSKNGSMTFLRGIQKGYYYSDGDNALEVAANEGGEVLPVFSVSSSKQVFFSKGNLQYQASTNTWRFAENQYDIIGNDNANIAANYSGWIDLFGFGTSGYEGKYPYMTSTNAQDYINQNLTGTYANYDWGVYNSANITNGEGYTTWRTLTKDEWAWVLGPAYSPNPGTNCRTTTTSNLTGTNNGIARFVMATVNNVSGMIIFPDNYSHPSNAIVAYNSPSYNVKNSFDKFVVDETNWNIMAHAGAVFIPAAGYRSVTTINQVGTHGYYWSTNMSGTVGYSLIFNNDNFNPSNAYTNAGLGMGHSVRLVRE